MSLVNRRPSATKDIEAAMPAPKAGEPVYDDVFLDVGSRGYHLQSQILGIPDPLGLFQRGAPRRNGFLGMLAVSLFGAFMWSIVLFMFYVVWRVIVLEPMTPTDAMVYGFMLGFLFVLALSVTGLDNLDRRWRKRRLLQRLEREMGERNGSEECPPLAIPAFAR
ncbi:hypothetical protein M440DRAFT_16778 [Trichoderma longibrachiatum ATCC 18648]|uniref:Uncharacterized protein n=1 Tax=Trichoderma longibrachiatum ATCC 18648 TaxID=983965 RepID=A0A2T4CGF7_TRILO|nr:hypothetical protein M440DRAFT_16778 [Trichoderma longibrachiatum ATCC 18648]